jgi:hypothetical protein
MLFTSHGEELTDERLERGRAGGVSAARCPAHEAPGSALRPVEDCFPLLPALGVVTMVEHVCGTAIPRAMRPFIQSVLRYWRQTLLEIERMHGLPS